MLTLAINNIDRSSTIDWASIRKVEVLTKEPDSLEFRIKNHPGKTYQPMLSDEIILTDNGQRIFGGLITETKHENEGLLKYFSCTCKDYTYLMDRKLVNKTYTGQTVSAIITDLAATFMVGFTTANVQGLSVIPKIVFNDEQPSKCIQKLADLLGNYNWYVDYFKDIHFFSEGEGDAPFNLDDATGNYVFGSLQITRNINQIRNSVIVRGGIKESSTLTDIKLADGQQKTFVAKPLLSNLTISKSTNGTSYTVLTIGQDGIDDAATKDVLYNPNNGFIIFREDNKLASGNFLKWSGVQVYPIKIVRKDWASISKYGEFQYVIKDENIKSEEQAKQRAAAEILKYAERINEGVFNTTKSGLKTGQWITIDSPALGYVDEKFKINRILFRARTSSSFEYEVHLIASETFGIIDALSKLLVGNDANIQTSVNEVPVNVEGYTEEIAFGESYLVQTRPTATPVFSESISMSELFRVNPFGLNVYPIWVAGSYFPVDGDDRKRTAYADVGSKVT